jgi:hypothetical protein
MQSEIDYFLQWDSVREWRFLQHLYPELAG